MTLREANMKINQLLKDNEELKQSQIKLIDMIKSMQIQLNSLTKKKAIAKPKNKIEYKSDSEGSESSDEPDDPNDSDYIPESDESDSDSSSISDEELCNKCKINDDDDL